MVDLPENYFAVEKDVLNRLSADAFKVYAYYCKQSSERQDAANDPLVITAAVCGMSVKRLEKAHRELSKHSILQVFQAK